MSIIYTRAALITYHVIRYEPNWPLVGQRYTVNSDQYFAHGRIELAAEVLERDVIAILCLYCSEALHGSGS